MSNEGLIGGMAHSMEELHAITMAAQIKPHPNPDSRLMALMIFAYQMAADDPEKLVTLGWLIKTDMAPRGDEDTLLKSLALLLALIRWRLGPEQFARIFPVVMRSA